MKIFLFIIILKISALPEIKLLEISYTSFINTKKLNEAYSVLKKMIQIEPNNQNLLKEAVVLSVWVGDYENWMKFVKKIPLEDIPKNQYNLIKTYLPDLYLELLIKKLKNKLNKENIYDAIKISINMNNKKIFNYLMLKYFKYLENYEKEKIIKKIIDSGLSELIINYTNILDKLNKDTKCNLYSKYAEENFFKNKENVIKILKSNFNICLNTRNFLITYTDISKIDLDYETYLKLLYILYEKDMFRPQDAEELIIKNLDNNKKLIEEISLKAYKKFKLKHFLYYYISTKPIDFNINEIEDENIRLYLKIINFNKYNYLYKKKIIQDIKKQFVKNSKLDTTLIWLINENLDYKHKEELSILMNCKDKQEKEVLTALSHFKTSLYDYKSSLDCFLKVYNRKNLNEIHRLSDLYYTNGYVTESLFYKRKIYDIYKFKNFQLEQRNKIDIIYNFEPNKIFINEIKDSKLTQQEKEDFIFDFYNKFNMIENIKNEISSNSVYQIYLNNIENKPYELNENLNLTPYLYINYYSKINDTPNTFKWLYKNLEQIPDNQYTYSNLQLNLEKFHNYKQIENIYLNNNLIQQLIINLSNPISNSVILDTEYSKIKFINRNIFYLTNKENKSLKLKMKDENKYFELSYNLWLKDFLSIKFFQNIVFPRQEVKAEIGLNHKTNVTTLSNILLLNDYISFYGIQKHSQNSKTEISISFSNYKDLDKKYFGLSKSIEINHQLKYKLIYFIPYIKYNYFNSKNNYVYNNIIKGQQKILPEDFTEVGTSLYSKYKNISITLIPSYNNRSNINYNLSITTSKILRKNSKMEIILTYYKNYETINSKYTSIGLNYKF